MKRIVSVFLLLIFLTVSAALFSNNRRYARISLEGTVNPISAEYIVDAVKRSQSDGVSFIILTIDTPGGLIGPMRDIIKEILTSTVPVVVYTYPKGAQAASAGGFIMLSGHLNAMAPGTEIGAMHPVSPAIDFGDIGGTEKKPSKVMAAKVLNDTTAYAKSIAQKRGRNIVWTEKAVTQAISSTYKEAKDSGVIDIIAEDIPDLLKQLDGRTIAMNGPSYKFSTSGIAETVYAMNAKQRVMNFFADPQIVFLLFIIGVAGIIFEIKSPGLIVPGVAGVLSFLIFLMAVRILPVNAAGVILIAAAIGLFILELNVTSYGLLTLGGIICFIAGSLLLFDSDLPGFSISLWSIASSVLLILGFMFGILRSILKTHKGRVITGVEGMIDEIGRALTEIGVKGKVAVHGEVWNASSDDRINKGDAVRIIGIEGLLLKVKRIEK